MSGLRVAIFTGNYNHIQDGVSLTLNRLVRHLLDRDISVMVFGPTVENPPMAHEGDFVAVPSIAAFGRPEYRISTGFPKSVREKLDQFSPDLIHIATPDFLGFKALKYARAHAIPAVASYHTHFTSYLKYYRLSLAEPLVWKYLKWFYSKCRHLYVPSASMIAELNAQNITDGLEVWARGVDTTLFSPDKRNLEWRRQLGFADEDVLVTFVSRLVWEKDLRTFAATLKKCTSGDNKVKVLIVGDGPEKEEFQKLLPPAHFAGYLSGHALATAYASSDIFFFPSDTETFGNVTLEAMSCGLPVVVADATGSKSLVDVEKNGFIGQPQNSDQFATFIKLLVHDNIKRNEMKKASRQKALAYDWDRVMDDLINLYTQAAGN